MDSLKRFFSNKKILKFKKDWGKIGLWIPLNDFFFLPKKILIQKRLGEDRIMDSLKRFFFSNKKLFKFKKGWEKIGGFPYLFFFSNKTI